MIRNQRGFTLIEIIAVLVILGILAAVAVPRYLDLASEAKTRAAEAQIAEIKSTLNLAYARLFISTGTAPAANDAAAVVGNAAFPAAGGTGGGYALGTSPDLWTFTITPTGGEAEIEITGRDGDGEYSAKGLWNVPPAP